MLCLHSCEKGDYHVFGIFSDMDAVMRYIEENIENITTMTDGEDTDVYVVTVEVDKEFSYANSLDPSEYVTIGVSSDGSINISSSELHPCR